MSLIHAIRNLPKSLRDWTAPKRAVSADRLATVVRRERARADRSGGEFCLLTFADQQARGDERALTQLMEYLTRRVRITDEYAAMSDRRLWLVLPDCPADAAVRIARATCGHFSAAQQRITYDLFHYTAPFKSQPRPSERNGQPTHRRLDEGPADMPERSDSRQVPEREVASPLARATPLWKRAIDLVLASVGLIALAPLMALIALLIKLTSRGPVLYVQPRAGRCGKPFLMYKFRTMEADAEQRKADLRPLNEQDGPAFKMQNDPRVTWLGRLLRATSLDELPQLWNVLGGQMSLVGPRPLPVDESEACEPWQLERLDVTPGLTCSWQVSDGRSRIPFAEWMRMDVRYARGRKLALDLLLMFQTLVFMIRRKGM